MVRGQQRPIRQANKGNVMIDIQKDLYLDDLAPLANGNMPIANSNNRISLAVSGACDEQTNDLEQRLVKVIIDWKKTLREEK